MKILPINMRLYAATDSMDRLMDYCLWSSLRESLWAPLDSHEKDWMPPE